MTALLLMAPAIIFGLILFYHCWRAILLCLGIVATVAMFAVGFLMWVLH